MLPVQLKADLEAELSSALVAVKRSLVRRIRACLPSESAVLELDAVLEDAPELASVAGLHVLLPRRVLENLLAGRPPHAARQCHLCGGTGKFGGTPCTQCSGKGAVS